MPGRRAADGQTYTCVPIQALRGSRDAAYLDVVQLMATKPMQMARYFCTGELADRDAWGAAPALSGSDVFAKAKAVGLLPQLYCLVAATA